MEGRAVTPLGWGVVGTGAIAADFAAALAVSPRCRVTNVVGSTPGKGVAFAARFGLRRSSATLAELLADEGVGAVYVATPHASHEAIARAAIDAGKPVLCEKPLALDAAGAARLTEAAARRGVFLMEAFMYRCHPVIAELLRRLAAGAIGTVRHVRATFGFRAAARTGRLFDPALGGGGILDVGGYPVSFARLVAGLREGRPFAEPTSLRARGEVGPTGVDELALAELRFSSGLVAKLACAVSHDLGTSVTVTGDAGRVELPDPWLPGGERQGLAQSFTIHGQGPSETVTVRTERPIYALEAELVADARPGLEARWPAMGWQDSVGNMRVLDAWRAAVHAGGR